MVLQYNKPYTPPKKNKIGVAIRNGKNIIFSFLYKPGAINFHNWINNIGNVIVIEIKKATLTWVKKPSCKAVNIILPPVWAILSAKGCCKKT